MYFQAKNPQTDKWENICFEELSEQEKHRILDGADKEFIKGIALRLAAVLKEIGDSLNLEAQ